MSMIQQTGKVGARWRIIALILLLPWIPLFADSQSIPSQFLSALKWRLIGPFRGGRVVAVAGVPGDSTTFYFGAVDGGIWKTTDAGVVWTPIFDAQKIASIGAIAVAPSNSKIVYAGTGESDIRSDLSSGNGVYKTTDGGASWVHMGLEDTRQISRIVVDPSDASVVYVGALGHAYGANEQRGVYKSSDGGTHWAKVLNLGPQIGVSDLAICAGNPKILLAAAWHSHRPPWSTYAPIDGPGGGIYRSQDAGKTWSRLIDGLPDGDWGRVGVEIAPDGKRVYALIQAKESGLYRSDDGGDTWVLKNADPRLTSRAWYFNRVTIDPRNSDSLYIPNIALYRSEDGGETVSIVRGAPGGDDYHQLWVDPKNSASMVLGTDQGTTISLDRGATWSTWYNQPTAQLYHVITDNQFPYTVYGAQQDSGAVAVLSRTNHGLITPRDWFPAGPSESGYMAPDPKNPDIIYLSGSYGSVGRFNMKTGLSQDVTPWPSLRFDSEINERKYRAPWSPPLLFAPADPSTLFFGTQFVMKTVDGGLHWDTISPDLTGSTRRQGESAMQVPPTIENTKEGGYGVVFTIAPSPINRDLIWAGSDTGLIHLTRDGGTTWKDVTPRGLADWSKISMIEASHFDPGVAYAAVDRSRLDDQTPYIYRTRDYGTSWQLTTSGIAAQDFVRAIRQDIQAPGLLFAGTELGVYASFDEGDHWQSLQLNLPTSSVRDLTIHGDDLVIATHGRSFWILDDFTSLRQMSEARAAEAWLFRPAVAFRVDSDSFSGTPLPPEEPTGENPADGAVIEYFLRSSDNSVTLEILDAQQNLVRKFFSEDQSPGKRPPLPIAERWFPKHETLEKTSGAHRFIWDLTCGSGAPVDGDHDSGDRPTGPKAVPGPYRLRLTVGGHTETQTLQVIMDPRSPATPATLQEQFRMGQKIYGETRETHRSLAEINTVQAHLRNVQQELGEKEPSLKSALAEAQMEISKILARKDPASGQGIGLLDANSGLSSALSVVEGGDRAIPSQAIAVYQEASSQARSRIAEWAAFKKKEVPALNQLLRKANLKPVEIAEIERQVEFLNSR